MAADSTKKVDRVISINSYSPVLRRVTFWPEAASERLARYASGQNVTLSTAVSDLVGRRLAAEGRVHVPQARLNAFDEEKTLYDTPRGYVAVPVSIPLDLGESIVGFADRTKQTINEALVGLATQSLEDAGS